ncbi:uncharacterized protein LOC127082372 [Lathyrus oleraceus]|uniref:uncharacterized protein LOC127082372 n=1 Tax=Pisum sativum TaxID=3888 RepID=UPI0021D2889B|nr:uncharacterized protein LOC127082372 [Pisum sativum]
MTIKSLLPTSSECRRCNAKLFHRESQDMCCKCGKVTISQVSAPDELLQLFLDSSTEGRHFRQHIRSYNHVDESLVATGHGIYTFRAQGAIYHKIGGFHPNQGSRPRYLQLYIYDTDHELQNRMRENPILNQAVVYKLQKLLHQCNPFVIVFRQLALEPNIEECRLLIKECTSNQPQYSLHSASQVAKIVIGSGDEDTIERGRDINVIKCDGKLTKVQETMGYYDPLQYPILLPFGTYGWDIETKTNVGKNVTYREYYNYVLQIRLCVDKYVKIETGRLRWIRRNQNNIRSEVYQGLQDALRDGENNADNVGQRTILSSSFIRNKRDMTQRYQDGMAIVLNNGKPDIFLTMTCNPSWIEITSELGLHQTPQDRLDLLTRIFRSKFEQLKDDVINKGVLGRVKTYMYVTEFQKRGLPHVHMLLILDTDDKLREPEEYDSVVKAEIPRHESEPELYEAVLKQMIHGPCGVLNQSSPCMKNGHCPDRVAIEVHRGTGMDEIQQYVDARWICAPEALWKIFKFTLYKLYPSVERLQIDLSNHHQVWFYKHQRITDVLNDNQNAVTMLTEFFALNQMDPHARNYLYKKIAKHYCWLKGVKKWQRRRTKRKVIGRIYTVSPSEGEKFYLRVLLSHLRGPTS